MVFLVNESGSIFDQISFTACGALVAAHLRTFLKECGSFAHTIFPGKHDHLRTQFSQVNVTFAHIRFSQVTGMFALARLHRQTKPLFPVKVAETPCRMIHISDTQTGIVMFITETNLKF